MLPPFVYEGPAVAVLLRVLYFSRKYLASSMQTHFEDLATGLSLSLGPMCGTLFRPKLDNRVTIYYSSRVN